MNTNHRFSARHLFGSLVVVLLIAQPYHCGAVDPEKQSVRGGQSSRPVDGARDAGQGDAGAGEQAPRDRRGGSFEEGSPSLRLRIRPGDWVLGVQVAYLDTGARITQVTPNTPAWRVGLEPDDRIVSVDGYQIGYVHRRFYEISQELNYRAGRTGWVRLLVQNCRNNQLINVDVQLARTGIGLPRERFNLSPDARLDQAGEAADRATAEPNRKPRIAR